MIDDVVGLLARTRFTATNEQRLQDGIAEVLEVSFAGRFAREFILSGRDRPDFMCVDAGIALEVKWATSGGTLTTCLRQLLRYAEHDAVRAIIFASPTRRIVNALPPAVGTKRLVGVILTTGY